MTSTITYENFTLNPVDFVGQMYDAGAQGYFDALSFHPYQYTMPFSTGGYHPDSPINQLDDIHDLMVANGDADKLIWASEYGQPTSVSSEAEQAAYLEDMLTTWREIGYAGPAFVYTLEDDQTGSTDPEATFGLIRSDGTWKPAAYVIQELAQSQETTAEMAQMALALPQSETAAPEDIAALQEIAGPTDPTAETQLAAAADQLMANAPTASATDPAPVTEPVATVPVRTQPTIVEPTLAEPTVNEPTITVAPSGPSAIPTPDLDAARSVELADSPVTQTAVDAPSTSTPSSVVDDTRSTDLSDVPTTGSNSGDVSNTTGSATASATDTASGSGSSTGSATDTASGSSTGSASQTGSDSTSDSTATSGSATGDSTSGGSATSKTGTSKSEAPKKKRADRVR